MQIRSIPGGIPLLQDHTGCVTEPVTLLHRRQGIGARRNIFQHIFTGCIGHGVLERYPVFIKQLDYRVRNGLSAIGDCTIDCGCGIAHRRQAQGQWSASCRP